MVQFPRLDRCKSSTYHPQGAEKGAKWCRNGSHLRSGLWWAGPEPEFSGQSSVWLGSDLLRFTQILSDRCGATSLLDKVADPSSVAVLRRVDKVGRQSVSAGDIHPPCGNRPTVPIPMNIGFRELSGRPKRRPEPSQPSHSAG